MKIVITGALGHIGSKLVRELPGRFPGAEIVMVDNMSTQRYCTLFSLPANGRYRFIEGDIMSADLAPIIEGADVLVHLAAITNAAGSFEMQEEVERVNYRGTVLVAQACAEKGVPFIFLSTTSVYGTQEEVVDENCSVDQLKPQSPYAVSKLKSEEHLARLAKSHGLKFIGLRFGTIFGTSPGMRFHTAVNKFIWQACAGLPITVWRTALHQKRPYLDLNDAVRTLSFIIDRKMYDGGIYNVLTLNATVNDIITAIKKHVDGLNIEFVDTKIMNQLSYNVSVRKFEATGFQFTGSLEKSVADTVHLLKGINHYVK